MITKADAAVPMIRGDKYRLSHQASVIGILGSDAPRVSSRGSQFCNFDRWTARFFTLEMCKWANANPECIPTRKDIQTWVNTANQQKVETPEIVIANTPDEIPLRTALALTGGAYHEAWHTLYSRKTDLTVDEMFPIVLPRWATVKDWSRYHLALQAWSNIIEDIRIERRGREQFEATYIKMCDLQDFILDMESQGQQDVRAHGGKKPSKSHSMTVIAGVFRDVGLGYNTEKQRLALERYRQESIKAVELVLHGPLAPILHEAIDLTAQDDLGCLRLAIDVIAKLAEISSEDQDSDEQSQDGEPGDGQIGCPICGAPANHLIVRPKPDGKGGKVKGRGIATCTSCGWQKEVPVTVKKSDPQKQSEKNPQDGVRFEGFDESDVTEDGESSGKDGNDSGQTEKKPSEDHSDGGKDSSEEQSKGQNNGNETSDGKGESKDDSQLGKDEQGDHGAGGHSFKERSDGTDDWSDVADEAIKQPGDDSNLGLKNAESVLGEAIGSAADKEIKDVKRGEAAWNPYDCGLDEAKLVGPSNQGKDYDLQQSDKILQSVRREIAFLRSRLRTIIRALEMTSVDRGVPKGRWLSPSYLVDTHLAIRDREQPRRAYNNPGIQLDMSFATVVIVDESGSMSSSKKDVTRIFCAVTEPFDGLGCPTMAMGFRNNFDYNPSPNRTDESKTYHRYDGVRYDIFKTWGERFNAVRWRFANTIADGGTPMADGIQYAIDAISRRDEANRVIFVVTDGNPDGGHKPIIKRQVRLAKEAGIYIVGVGLGQWSKQVIALFEDSIWADDVIKLPTLITRKLNDIIDVRGSKRGRRVKSTQ